MWWCLMFLVTARAFCTVCRWFIWVVSIGLFRKSALQLSSLAWTIDGAIVDAQHYIVAQRDRRKSTILRAVNVYFRKGVRTFSWLERFPVLPWTQLDCRAALPLTRLSRSPNHNRNFQLNENKTLSINDKMTQYSSTYFLFMSFHLHSLCEKMASWQNNYVSCFDSWFNLIRIWPNLTWLILTNSCLARFSSYPFITYLAYPILT